MFKYLLLLLAIGCFGCASQDNYTWQEMQEPRQDDFRIDLEACRAYAARQYKPGIPAGTPYLGDIYTQDDFMAENERGVWRPDRNPTERVNINSLPVHDITTEYTGYPGEFDYNPDALDEILEKCMSDHGWEYRPETEQ